MGHQSTEAFTGIRHDLSLREICDLAGADRWNSESVAAHKVTELAKAPPASTLWKHKHNIEFLTALLFVASLVGAVLGLAGIIINGIFALFRPGVAAHGMIFSIAMFCISVVILRALDFMRFHARGPAQWRTRYALATDQLPARARLLVEDIRLLLPDARFRLVELVQDMVVIDPILEVAEKNFGPSYVPILVWDKAGIVISPPN